MNHTEIEETIAELLVKHAYCLIKNHRLVINNKKILMRCGPEYNKEDITISKITQDRIFQGFTSNQWAFLTEVISLNLKESEKCQPEPKP